jgi:endonuclease G
MASNSPLDRLAPKQRAVILLAVCVVALVIGIIQARRQQQQQPEPAPAPAPAPGPEQPGEPQPGERPPLFANRNVRYGMPAPATADPTNRNAYLLDRPQYVLSYNDSKRTANWVCWNVNKGDIGKVKRPASFEPDPDLPGGFHRVKHGDYTGFGFDRGHMCPSKDRSESEETNKVTFYTTNIVPQSPACNRGGWERFESHCRDLLRDGTELYIAAGPFGQGGTAEFGERKTIGKGGADIVVPAAVWKVVMVLPNRDAVPTATTRTLAVWMPNDQSVPEDWKPYAVSVAEVEKRTGYRFFPLVPADVASAIKGHVDRGP